MEKILIIRESDFKTKADALEHIASELGFPSYFGGNLDALFDCLCDLDEDTNIAFDNPVFGESPEWYVMLCDTVIDAAMENECITLYCPVSFEDMDESEF